MSQRNNKTLINGINSKGMKKNYLTNKTDVYHFDDIWSLDIFDLKHNGPENNRRYRYVLVVIDIFSKHGWTTPLKNKKAITITNSFKNILINSKTNPGLIESDGGMEIEHFFSRLPIKTISKFILEIVL